MNRVKSVIFSVVVILLSACSTVGSFKLVNAERQQHELIATNVQPTVESQSEEVQTKSVFEEQQHEQQISTSSQLKEVKHLVVEQHTKVVQTVKKSATKLKEFVGQKKIQPSDNFWLDLIRDFLLFMLVAMIIVGIIAAMIVYGNPTIQLIGKVLAITLIVIGTIALLFS